MKSVVFAALAALGMATLASAPALADTSIGVVNVQKIMRDSKAAQSVRAQLQAKQKAFQADLDAREKQLYSEDQALAKEQATAKDKAAFEKKVKDFRAKAAAAQRDVQTKKQQLDKAFEGALSQIQTTVGSIVKEVASEKKMNTVVSSSQVLYSEPAMDVTEEVLKRLDTKMPTVAVKF